MTPVRSKLAALLTCSMLSALLTGLTGCYNPKPQDWSYTGPRVYLIAGTDGEQSEGLWDVQQALEDNEINARVLEFEDWLDIVEDIDCDSDEEVILVGHGHGGFLATQVVRHYAQSHKMKHIEAIYTIDAYNKDWPHSLKECGRWDPHHQPMAIPVGQNALKVRNYTQSNADSRRWGSDLASTRASELACEHPYYWYDDYWTREDHAGQRLGIPANADGIVHETIDNNEALVQRIIKLCRKSALSPFHYTPPEHHPYVAPNRPKPQTHWQRKSY